MCKEHRAGRAPDIKPALFCDFLKAGAQRPSIRQLMNFVLMQVMVIYSKLCNHAHHQKENVHYHLNTVCWPQLEYNEAFPWVNSSVSLKLTFFWKFLTIQTSLGLAFTSLCIPALHLSSPLMFSAVSTLPGVCSNILQCSVFRTSPSALAGYFTHTQLFIYSGTLTQQT